MKFKTLAILLLLLAQNVMADVYYCADEDATGFEIRDGKYKASNFYSKKFKIKWDASAKTIILKEKDYLDTYSCQNPYSFNPLIWACMLSMRVFMFNSDTGAFTRFSGLGYLDGVHDGADSIVASYGTCDKFD